jgi:hypothetical protein
MKNLFIVLYCILFCGLAEGQPITWKVDNNFRLLKNNSDQEWLKHVASQSSQLLSTTLTISDLRTKWHAVPESHYDKTTGSYTDGYVHVKSWSITVTFEDQLQNSSCEWTLNDKKFIGPCSGFSIPLKLDNSTHKLSVTNQNNSSALIEVKISDLLFVGLGDSYASGEGVPEVFKTWYRYSDWLDKKCHRSIYSWQSLVAARYAVDYPHKSVTFISRACSGALIAELTTAESSGATGEEDLDVAGSKFIRPQLTSLLEDLCPIKATSGRCDLPIRQPDFVLLSIGGNDAQFATIIKDAILGNVNDGINLKAAYRKYAVAGVKRLRNDMPQLARRLASAFPQSKIISTNYPDPLHRKPSAFCGVDRADGIDYLRLKSRGFIGFLASLIGKRETNQEIAAIYDDFIVRLTGSSMPKDEDYRGLLQIGQDLSAQHAYRWFSVPMRKGLVNHSQVSGYQPHGFCLPGEDVAARWFLTVDDSEADIGGISGSIHPNIFGQLYYTQKVFDDYVKQTAGKPSP